MRNEKIKKFKYHCILQQQSSPHLAHKVHPHPIGGGDVDGGPVEDVAHALDVVAAVAVV